MQYSNWPGQLIDHCESRHRQNQMCVEPSQSARLNKAGGFKGKTTGRYLHLRRDRAEKLNVARVLAVLKEDAMRLYHN